MTLIDIGANLTHESFEHDFDEVLQRAADVGVSQFIVTGASTKGSVQALEIANRQENLYATAGIHPHHAEESTKANLSTIADLITEERVVAVGETGLDFFRDLAPRDAQQRSFEAHIEIAAESKLPMFLHERDAYPRFAEIISTHRDAISDAVVHCFTGEKDALYRYLDLDCYIGITGWICDERRGEHLLKLVKDIPDHRLLIETDAPYLMPRTIRPKPKTRRNEPCYLTYVRDTVASCRDQSTDHVAMITSDNARRLFSLPDPPPRAEEDSE